MKRYVIFIITLTFSLSVFSQEYNVSEKKYYNILNSSRTSESSLKYYNISNTPIISESQIKNYNLSIDIPIYGESTLVNYYIDDNSSLSSISSSNYFNLGYSQKNNVPKSTNDELNNENIPITNTKNKNTYALIIGNEDYKSYQTDLNFEQNVDFAINDSKLFREICIKTLGIPNDNIIYLENAGYVKMKQALSQLELISKHARKKTTLIFYYAGHGLPDNKTKIPHIIPVDVSGSSLDYAISLPELYESLTKYPVDKVIAILDACFTGGARNDGLVASRGVKIVPKEKRLNGNIVSLSASSSDQPAKPYKEKKHGLFTYYLTKKIIESKGDLTLGELDKYLSKTIPLKSIMINKIEQVPKTNISKQIENEWKGWKLK
jgi:hypothetical protein